MSSPARGLTGNRAKSQRVPRNGIGARRGGRKRGKPSRTGTSHQNLKGTIGIGGALTCNRNEKAPISEGFHSLKTEPDYGIIFPMSGRASCATRINIGAVGFNIDGLDGPHAHKLAVRGVFAGNSPLLYTTKGCIDPIEFQSGPTAPKECLFQLLQCLDLVLFQVHLLASLCFLKSTMIFPLAMRWLSRIAILQKNLKGFDKVFHNSDSFK